MPYLINNMLTAEKYFINLTKCLICLRPQSLKMWDYFPFSHLFFISIKTSPTSFSLNAHCSRFVNDNSMVIKVEWNVAMCNAFYVWFLYRCLYVYLCVALLFCWLKDKNIKKIKQFSLFSHKKRIYFNSSAFLLYVL